MKLVNVSNFTHNTISLKTSQIIVADGGGATSIWRKVVHYHFPLFFRNMMWRQLKFIPCFLFPPHFESDNELLPIPKKKSVQASKIWIQLVNNMTLLKKNWGLFLLLVVSSVTRSFKWRNRPSFGKLRLKESLNAIVVRGSTEVAPEINVGNSNDLDALFYRNIEIETILLPQGWQHDGPYKVDKISRKVQIT